MGDVRHIDSCPTGRPAQLPGTAGSTFSVGPAAAPFTNFTHTLFYSIFVYSASHCTLFLFLYSLASVVASGGVYGQGMALHSVPQMAPVRDYMPWTHWGSLDPVLLALRLRFVRCP